jgi:hypothetical protein
MPFDAASQTPWAIPFAFEDYLELVDWIGRAIRSDKRWYIPPGHPAILDRLGIDPEQFIGYSERMLKAFGTAVGRRRPSRACAPGGKPSTCAASVQHARCLPPSGPRSYAVRTPKKGLTS